MNYDRCWQYKQFPQASHDPHGGLFEVVIRLTGIILLGEQENRLEQTDIPSAGDRLHAAVHSQFSEDIFQMGLNRVE